MIYWIIVGLVAVIFTSLLTFDYYKYNKIKHSRVYISSCFPGFSMNRDIVFDTANSRGNITIINNTSEIVLVEIRNEIDECVYVSKSIQQKKFVDVDCLLVNLVKGKYNCVAYAYSIDIEQGYCDLQDSFPVTIKILN